MAKANYVFILNRTFNVIVIPRLSRGTDPLLVKSKARETWHQQYSEVPRCGSEDIYHQYHHHHHHCVSSLSVALGTPFFTNHMSSTQAAHKQRVLDSIEQQFALPKETLHAITHKFVDDFNHGLSQYNNPMAMMYVPLITAFLCCLANILFLDPHS